MNILTTHFGDETCKVLPAYHSITTSFPFHIGKIKLIKKMVKQAKSHLLPELNRSVHSVQEVTSAKCLFRSCMHSGSEQESFFKRRSECTTLKR